MAREVEIFGQKVLLKDQDDDKSSSESVSSDQFEQADDSGQSDLSGNIDQKIAQLQEADLQQKIASGISDAAAQANKAMNDMLSGMMQPIYDTIQQFKTVPPKIRKIVDVSGAANGMYDQMDKFSAAINQIQEHMVSSEVPITLGDYRADPTKYSNLMAIEYQRNDLTEEDCLSSGYTKIVWDVKEEYIQKLKDLFPLPQDRDIVGKQMEKLIGTTIKSTWQMAQTPIKTVSGIANIGPIPGMIQSIVDSIDAIVKIASKTIPEKKLDEMLAQKTLAQEKAKAETEKVKQLDLGIQSEESLLTKAMSAAESAISQSYDGVAAGISESFANFETPSIPDDIKETIDDFKDSIIMVKDNISNIYIIILFKMVGAILKCLTQIAGVIGVPSIPDPLGKVPQIITDYNKIMEFISGLPMSLVQCLIAIIKRKMKAVMIAMTPAPPLPLPEKIPIPPTSASIVKPETTWDDVRTVLTDDYKFSGKDTDEIISKLQAFFDGSGEEIPIITKVQEQYGSGESNSPTAILPEFGANVKRIKMMPLYCKDTWIKSNLETMEQVGEGYVYILKPPVKISETSFAGKFYIQLPDGGNTKFDYDDYWSTVKDYMSGVKPY